MRKLLAAILLLCGSSFGTTLVSGNIRDLGGNTIGSTKGSYARFYLRGCGRNQPRVPTGTAAIAPKAGANGIFYFDILADSSGALSDTVYSTRDTAGTGNGEIECGGSRLSVWYGVVIYANGTPGPETPFHAQSGVTLNLPTAVPLSVLPVATAPDGDVVYARLDGANQPFTGRIHITTAITSGNALMVDGTNATSLTDTLVGTSSDYRPGGVYFNFVNGAGTTNRMFGTVAIATATAGGTGVVAEGETVGLYGGALRSGGTRPIWGLNTEAQAETVGNATTSIEADINNNTGVDATISSAPTDQQYGVHVVSGGTNKPQAGLRIDSSSSADVFKEGIQVLSYDTHGIRVAGPNEALIIVPTVEDANAEVVGTHTNGSAGPWQINHDGSGSFSGTITGGDFCIAGPICLSSVTTFLGLTDTPSSYTGQTLKAVRVNAGETALEFYTPSAGGAPGSPDASVQFACTGAFCGDAGLLYDSASQTLHAGNRVRIGGNLMVEPGNGVAGDAGNVYFSPDDYTTPTRAEFFFDLSNSPNSLYVDENNHVYFTRGTSGCESGRGCLDLSASSSAGTILSKGATVGNAGLFVSNFGDSDHSAYQDNLFEVHTDSSPNGSSITCSNSGNTSLNTSCLTATATSSGANKVANGVVASASAADPKDANALNVSGRIKVAFETPASSSANCTTGQTAVDANYLYVCTTTNTWKRAALSTF